MFMHGNKQPTVAVAAAWEGAGPRPPKTHQQGATSAHFNLIKNYFTDAKYF